MIGYVVEVVISMKMRKIEHIQLLLTLGLILSIFIMTSLKVIGYLGLLLVLFASLIEIVQKGTKIRVDGVLISSVLFILILCFRLITQSELYVNTFNSIFVQSLFVMLGVVVKSSKVTYAKWEKPVLLYLIFVLGLGVCLFCLSSLESSVLFGSSYGNLLFIAFSLSLILFSRTRKKYIFFLLILALFLSWCSGMRSAFFAEICMVGVYLFLSCRRNSIKRNTYLMIVWAVALICILVPYLYIGLFNAKNGVGTWSTVSNYLVGFVREKTGANFFSGRQEIWMNVIEALKLKPFLGYGIGFSVSNIYDTHLSAHNLFLFCRLETGVLGLMAFLYVLINYMKQIYRNVRFRIEGLAFVVGVLVQQTFTLGLLSGKGSFAVLCWFIFAVLSIDECVDEKRRGIIC